MAELTPNPSLIRGLTRADLAASATRPTMVTHFERNGRHLYYINAAHVNGEDNSTIHTIAAAMKKYGPAAVVVESTPDAPLAGGEVGYTASLAQARGMPVYRGEPNDAALIRQLQAQGVSPKEVMALYLLRNVPRDRAQGLPMDEQSVAQRAEQYWQTHPAFASIPASERLNFAEFKAWYDQRKPAGAGPYSAITANDTAPIIDADANYFQQLHAKVAKAREIHLNDTIAGALNRHGNVLVVYGGAHLDQSRPVYEKMLGAATQERLAGIDTRSHHASAERPLNIVINISLAPTARGVNDSDRGLG